MERVARTGPLMLGGGPTVVVDLTFGLNLAIITGKIRHGLSSTQREVDLRGNINNRYTARNPPRKLMK